MAAGGPLPGLLFVGFAADPWHKLTDWAIGIPMSKPEAAGVPISGHIPLLVRLPTWVQYVRMHSCGTLAPDRVNWL